MLAKATQLLTALLLIAALAGCRPAQPDTDAPIPVETGYKEINGARLYYEVMGRGEPIVIVHGGPALDHSYLLPQLGRLADGYRLIFFDQRLCGKSDADVDSATISIEGFVQDIEGIRKAFDLKKMTLMGHSWGSLLAMNYAIRHPEQLDRLILLDAVPASSELRFREDSLLATRFTSRDSAERAAIINSEAFRNNDPAAFAQLFRLLFRKEFHNPDLADSLTLTLPADFRERSTKFNYMGKDLENYDLHDALAAVDCPTLLLYGRDEPSATIAAPRLKESLPRAELVVLPDCGHFPYIEQPQAFRQAIDRFMQRR